MPAAVDLARPATESEWNQAQVLINELIDWDVDQSRKLGFDRAEVLRAFYPGSLEDIRIASSAPEGAFLIARTSGGQAGCAAFQRWSSDVCELYSVYVSPAYRGFGIGSRLINRLQYDAAVAGYRAMYLETATFMHSAHKLYRAARFEVCEHYRARPTRFREATISMRCGLSDEVGQRPTLLQRSAHKA